MKTIPYERVGRHLIAKGSILDYYQDDIKLPDGSLSKWDYIAHKGAAAALPVLPDKRILLVRQYRNALDRETLEIPAGGLKNPKERMLAAAKRELKEETGYRAGKMERLLTIHTTVAFCSEKIGIYLATELVPGKQHLDPDEFLNVEAYPLEKLLDLIYAGKIMDSKTVCAILAYKNKFA